MKSKWFAFGCLTSVIVLIIIIIFSVGTIGRLGKSFQKDVSKPIIKDSYLLIDPTGPINDYNRFEDNFITQNITSLHSLMEKINSAAHDDRIKGIILKPRFVNCGYANLNELSNSLRKFQEKGKKVYAYFDMCYDRDYLLATVADKIYLNPSASAGILFTGIGGNSLFFKGLLQKVGVDIKVIHAGKYKGAGENFSRKDFSDPVKRNLNLVFDELYGKIIGSIATNRNVTHEEIFSIYEKRDEIFISGNRAIELDLVDELIMEEELYRKLAIDREQLVPIEKYTAGKRENKANKIAIVYASGMITPVNNFYSSNNISASYMHKILDKISNDNSIKAIVIRVNSPGGSALESEIIWKSIANVKEKKPVVISMGNVAASGGYYISANADHIVADPFTITGSIGVVAMIANASEMAGKIGLTTDNISRGKYADLLNIYAEPKKEHYDALQRDIIDTYLEFKQRVATGRNIELGAVENIAQGQVWSAELAEENGLIDQVGMMNDAVIKAAELAQIEDYSVVFMPEKQSFLERFLSDRFDLDMTGKVLKQQFLEQLEIEKLLMLLENVKQAPIQAIMEYEIK